MESLGERLARLRDGKGWTNAELSRRAGLGPSGPAWLSRLMNRKGGTTRVNHEFVRRCAAALGVHVSELYESDPPPDLGPVDVRVESVDEAIEVANRAILRVKRMASDPTEKAKIKVWWDTLKMVAPCLIALIISMGSAGGVPDPKVDIIYEPIQPKRKRRARRRARKSGHYRAGGVNRSLDGAASAGG